MLVFALSCVILVVCYFIPHKLISVVLLSICTVLISSIDVASIVINFARKFNTVSNEFKQIDLYKHRRMIIWKELIIIGLYVLVSGLTHGFFSHYGENLSTDFKSTTIQILCGLLIVLRIWSYLMENLQKRFFFSVLKNPFISLINRSEMTEHIISYLVFGVDKIGELILIFIRYCFFFILYQCIGYFSIVFSI